MSPSSTHDGLFRGPSRGSPRTEELEDGLSQPFSPASRTYIPPTASSVMLPTLLERVGQLSYLG